MKLTVPKEQRKSLAWLLSAPDERIEALERALHAQKAGASIEVFGGDVAASAGLPDPSVVYLLSNLHRLRDEEPEESFESFLDSVCEAAEETGDKQLQRPQDGWGTFKDTLRRLLDAGASLWLTAKATVLANEHERVLCRSRCFTDARPIFRRDVESGPLGFAIMHSLMLTVHFHGKMEDIFIAMNPATMRELRKGLDRALAKAASLADSLTTAGLDVLPSKE